MKKIILISALILFAISCKAQPGNQALLNIIPLQDYELGTANSNDYVKDLDGLLDPFVGTWLYTNGTTSLKFIIKKAINHNNNYYHEDMLYGEYQYIENGTTIINSLPQIDQFQLKAYNSIVGNTILLNNDVIFPCQQCEPNEKRVELIISNSANNSVGTLYLRHITVNNVPAISAYVYFTGIKGVQDPNINEINQEAPVPIPRDYYTLIKQP